MRALLRYRYQCLCVLVGLSAGIAWFIRNLLLPGSARGFHCCDAEHYIGLSGVSDLFGIVGSRTFGYPLYLGTVRQIFQRFATLPPMEWLTAALVGHMCVWIVCASALFAALRRSLPGYSWLSFALLLAHPTFSSYSAVPVTDTLASALFCAVLACALLLSNRSLKWWATALTAGAAGFMLSYITAMRPNFQLVSAAFPIVITAEHLLRTWWIGARTRTTIRHLGLILVCFAVGYTPLYARLVSNCYKKYGEFCILEPNTMAYAQQITVETGISAVRSYASTISNFRSTGDPFFSRLHTLCRQSLGKLEDSNPTEWLLQCYASQPWSVPLLWFKKSISAFDNYALSAYATDITSTPAFYFNHVFSLFGFLGFFAAIAHLIKALLKREDVPLTYIALPLLYAGMQLNLHIETRFFFPTYPIFFLLWFQTARHYIWSGGYRRIVWGLTQTALAFAFFFQTWAWNLGDCRFYVAHYEGLGKEIPADQRISSCPRGQEATDWETWYMQTVPTWPLSY